MRMLFTPVALLMVLLLGLVLLLLGHAGRLTEPQPVASARRHPPRHEDLEE